MTSADTNGVGHGVVEGFYGPPWSFEARRRIVRALASAGLTTYAYAPKSDPHHRARWWEPLDTSELAAFAALCRDASDVGVRLIYGIAPQRLFGGRSNLAVTEAERGGERFTKLADRCLSLAERGVRSFMLLFDDTWATVFPRFASYALGRAHARIVVALRDVLRSAHEGVSITAVPAIYSGRPSELSRGAITYLRGLASVEAFPIAWTGPRIFSSFVSGSDLESMKRVTGQPTWLWSNAIANDWLPLATGGALGLGGRQRLCFGPPVSFGSDVPGRAAGILLNGAREPIVTEAALLQLGEALRDPPSFSARHALQSALHDVYGRGASVVATLAEHVAGHPLASPHVQASARIARLFDAPQGPDLPSELDELVKLPEEAKRVLADHPGLDELLPTAEKIAASARALAAALRRSPSARRLAKEALASPWTCGLDPLVRLAHDRRL